MIWNKKTKKLHIKTKILKAIIRNFQENDREGSTLDGNSKNSAPDTLSLTIKDSHFVEVVRIHTEACSQFTIINRFHVIIMLGAKERAKHFGSDRSIQV